MCTDDNAHNWSYKYIIFIKFIAFLHSESEFEFVCTRVHVCVSACVPVWRYNICTHVRTVRLLNFLGNVTRGRRAFIRGFGFEFWLRQRCHNITISYFGRPVRRRQRCDGCGFYATALSVISSLTVKDGGGDGVGGQRDVAAATAAATTTNTVLTVGDGGGEPVILMSHRGRPRE